MSSPDKDPFLIDFSTYRSAGVKNQKRPEEEKLLAADVLSESLGFEWKDENILSEASTAIGLAKFLAHLPEGTVMTTGKDAGLIHMRLQGHAAAEAYRLLETVPDDHPLAADVKKIRKGLWILFSEIAKALEIQNSDCSCDVCLLGKTPDDN